jgi:hypothetical protein
MIVALILFAWVTACVVAAGLCVSAGRADRVLELQAREADQDWADAMDASGWRNGPTS